MWALGSILPSFWNSWALCVWFYSPCALAFASVWLLHPGACARRDEWPPPLAARRSTVLFMSHRTALVCLKNRHCSPGKHSFLCFIQLPEVKDCREAAKHNYLSVPQVKTTPEEWPGDTWNSVQSTSSGRCFIPIWHHQSCQIQLTEQKHKKRRSNPEQNGFTELGREPQVLRMQTQAVGKAGSMHRKSRLRTVPVVSDRGRKLWLAAHWSIVWFCIGSDSPGHEIRSWVFLKMSCYFTLFFNFMFDMSSHIYLAKLCFAGTPTAQLSLHSWCSTEVLAGSRLWGCLLCQALSLGTNTTSIWIWQRDAYPQLSIRFLTLSSQFRSKIKHLAAIYQS